MGLFDGVPLSLEEVRQRLYAPSCGATVRRLTASGLVRTVRHKPWADLLGPGPVGLTCGDCVHLRRRRLAKVYFKCSRQVVTGGPGTDIRAKDPACRLFGIDEHP